MCARARARARVCVCVCVCVKPGMCAISHGHRRDIAQYEYTSTRNRRMNASTVHQGRNRRPAGRQAGRQAGKKVGKRASERAGKDR